MADTSLLTMLGLGFLLGVRHAFDADHIAAMSTILSRQPRIRMSGFVGLCWGCGHTLTLFVVGLFAVLLHITIPDAVAQAFEFGVGVMLVGLGGSLAWSLYREHWHLHAHDHGGGQHIHLHRHGTEADHEHSHWKWSIRPLLVGMVHGLAGSAALMLLVLSSVNNMTAALTYIVVFGIGSIVGMALIGLLISLPFVCSASLTRRGPLYVQTIASLTSIALGATMMIHIGVTGRVF